MPGDYNRNGVVELTDFNLWRDTWGEVVAPLTGADGNGDGVVDLADYCTWTTHYGQTYTPPAAATLLQATRLQTTGPLQATALLQATGEADPAFQP